MSFKDIKGQDKAIAVLKNAVRFDRLSHAYIFSGPEGIGKSFAALTFAKLLNCLDMKDDEPCGGCASCRKIDSSNHPDVMMLSPEKPGASIGIEKVRALIKDIGLKPYEAKKKFYIIDGAEAMTREASNAFLKTLEEPPSDSILILITRNAKDLLSTIISRCQSVNFYPLSIDKVREILVKDHKTDEASAQALAHLSSGRLGKALEYKENDFLKKREKIIKGLAGGDFFEQDFDSLTKADLRLYLDVMLTWYRDIMVSKVSADAPLELVNIDKKSAILSEAKRLDLSYIDKVMRQIMLTGSFLDINANPKLTMSVLSLNALENTR